LVFQIWYLISASSIKLTLCFHTATEFFLCSIVAWAVQYQSIFKQKLFYISESFSTCIITCGINLFETNVVGCLKTNIPLSGPFNNKLKKQTKKTHLFHILEYAAAGIFVICAAVALAFGTVHASDVLHRRVLGNCLRAPMHFFDTTPSGRILNRFGKDLDVADSTILTSIEMWLKFMLRALGTVIMIIYSTPIILVTVTPLAILFFFMQVKDIK